MKNSNVLKLSPATRTALKNMVAEGWIQEQRHPYFKNLAIYNYSKKTQFARNWNLVTKMCRGLVVDTSTWRIVINSPRKFFNTSEPEAPDVSQWEPEHQHYYEKLDGYYISARYDDQYGLIVTSRGSFDSKYAKLARQLITKNRGVTNLQKDHDYFFELLANFQGDESIIVTKYEGEPKLVLWGFDGAPADRTKIFWCDVAKELTHDEAKKYLETDVEGLVLYNDKTGERAKVKTSWYLTMHRAISGCTKNRVWEVLQGGGRIEEGLPSTTYTDLQKQQHTLDLTQIPEEHLGMMIGWAKELQEKFDYYYQNAEFYHDMYKDWTDKDFAQNPLVPLTFRSLVFSLRKQKDPTQQIWRLVKKSLLSNSEN